MDKDKRIVEGFGGFLNTAKQFISGVGKGALDNTIFASKEKTGQDFPAAIYSAEVLRNAIINTANSIDNILSAIEDKELSTKAKASASEMISFLRSSFTQIDKIISDGGSGNMTEQEMKSIISEISKKLEIMTRAGGILQKWKDEFLGANNERLAGQAYLDKGKALVDEGRKIMLQVANIKELEAKIESTSFGNVMKRSLDAITTGDTRELKPKNIKTFGKDPKDQEPETIKEYRDRLAKLGLQSKDSGDTYGTDDQAKTKQAMQYIGSVNGKVYTDSDEALRDFQRDLGIYTSKQDEIKNILGVK